MTQDMHNQDVQDTTEAAPAKAVETPLAEPKNQKHRWYIIHAHSGAEKKVARTVQEKAEKKGCEALISEILVPCERVTEVRRGAKVETERNIFPGYVLICMELNDDLWHLIRQIPKVSGFLGSKRGRPSPLPKSEADRILQQIQEGFEQPRSTLTFEVGEQVRVCDGPFASFAGAVEEVDEERTRLKVSVSIFGRATPVDLDFNQVEKQA